MSYKAKFILQVKTIAVREKIMKYKIFLITAVFVTFCSVELLFAQSPVQDNPKNPAYTLQDTTLAAEYFATAEKLVLAAQYDSSNFYFEKAREIYERFGELYNLKTIWKKLLLCNNRLAGNLLDQGQYELAMNYLNKSLEISKIKLGGDNAEVALSNNYIGMIYGRMGNYERALDYFQKSLSINLRLLGEEHPSIIQSYNYIGIMFWKKGNFDRALEFYQKSLSISIRLFGEQHLDVANSYNNVGLVYWNKGDYDRALEIYQKSISIRLQLLGEEHPLVAGSYNNIGLIYNEKGDYDRALEYYKKYLSINLRLFGEEHPEVAQSYNNTGVVYKRKSDYDRALEYYQKAVSISLQLFGEEPPDIATNYHNIGTVYQYSGDYDRALEYYNKALSINLRLLGGEHPDVADSYNNIGNVYSDKGDYDRSIGYFRKALTINLSTFGNLHPAVADVYRGFADVYFQKHDLNMALRYCQKSLISLVPEFDNSSIYSSPPLEGISSEDIFLNSLLLKAEIFTSISDQTGEKDLGMAFSTYQLAVDLIDKMRTGYKAVGSKLLLGENSVAIYEEAIETALKLHKLTKDKSHKEAAFLFAEKGKASVLSLSLQETQAKTFGGIPDSLLVKERQLKIDLAFYDTQIEIERQKRENRDESKIEEFEGRYFSSNTKYESLIEELETNYPKYYDLKYQTQSVSIPELQAALDSQTTVVEYFTGEKSITIFTVAKDHFEVTTVAKDSLFETDIEQIRTGIYKHDYTIYVKSAYRLYLSLIQPVFGHLNTRNLIIIPDHVLANVPFEALLTEDTGKAMNIEYSSLPYLLKKYQVSYAYSANLLLDLLNRRQPDTPKDYLAFAPVFPNGISSSSRAADLLQANHDLDSTRTAHTHLPASRDEVLGIQKLFRQSYGIIDRMSDWLFGNKSRVYLESQADEENLKSTALKDYRYIHFATHGFANHTTPELSGLLLAQNSTSTEDNVLFLGEVYNLELNADLVTLSACESGIGKSVKGEGLLSLSRGFLYAGAKNLVVSLWKADDRATSTLMLAFYEDMLKEKSKAQALRQAKLRLVESQRSSELEYADPYYWASFILIGK